VVKPVRPLLHGIRGLTLTAEEKTFLRECPPMGFILFARNIESVEQTRALCDELAEYSVFDAPLIAVDQEGGRVQRVRFGGKLPPARVFGEWFKDVPDVALEAIRLNAFLLAAQLRDVGANWLLGPMLDVSTPATHAIIGDRSFSEDASSVSKLSAAYGVGVAEGGCFACLKHAPGHGRAVADSHVELPCVDVEREALQVDFIPFKALAREADFMMTAHIKYAALDSEQPATYSKKIISMMREEWGFNGVLLADDVGMKALDGSYVERIKRSLNAGCDVAITALSVLQHGMAGTVYDEASFAALVKAELPTLNARAQTFLEGLKPLEAPDAEKVSYAKARLKQLWADGPARMGYSLDL
jgi:beta-N-acetylhexosaminidase